jgi:hypothetical protein
MAPAADAKKKKPYKRTATHSYTHPAVGSPELGGNCVTSASCGRFPTTSKDKYVVVKIVDDSGLPVAGTITHPDSNGDGFVERLGTFCGTSIKIAIQPGNELIVFPYLLGNTGALAALGGPEQCLGVGTQGDINVTFTSK